MADIVILGAGVTGLSAAYHLEQHGFFDYKLFEQESTVGGLCRSINQDGFTFDYTGHLLHVSDPYFRHFIEQHIGLEHFYAIDRRSFIYSHKTYTNYPYQLNLFGLPPSAISECIEGFATRSRPRTKTPSFYQWVLANFGTGLGKHFFFPYQNKIFDFDIKKLSASWTQNFVPQTSLHDMIMGAFQPHHAMHVGYNAHFLYPKKGGNEFWIKKLQRLIHNPIHTGYQATHINTKHNYIRFANGHEERYKYLLSTIPLKQLLLQLQETSATTLARAEQRLLCTNVTNFNLGLKHPQISDKHWIYFPETKFPFYRLVFPHNFSPSLAPSSCSSIAGEFSLLHKNDTAIATKLTNSLTTTAAVLNIDPQDIISQAILNIPYAYVVYDRWRDQHINSLHEQLNNYHIASIGRYGGWKYSSMQDCFLEGKDTVQKLIHATNLEIPRQPSRESML